MLYMLSYFSSLVCAHVSPPLSLSSLSFCMFPFIHLTNDYDDHVFRMNCGVRLAHYYWWYVCKDLCSFSLRISLFPIYTFDHVHCDYQQLKNVGYSTAFFNLHHMSIIFNMWLKSLSLSSINSQITCISSAHFTINPLIWNDLEAKKVSSNLLSSLSISNF